MIALERRPDGAPLRVGHRGAAHLAPENTIAGFRTAVDLDCDLVELDVLDLRDGTLVVAHSDDLAEVSHGRARGRVRSRSLAELRRVAPDLPTLDDALAFFADEATGVGVHVDLKLRTHLDALVRAIVAHGLEERTVVSSAHVPSLRTVAALDPAVRIGLTYPEDRIGISRKPALWPVVSLGLSAMRASVPLRLPRMTRRAGATAVMLQHRLVTPEAVERAHALGAAVLAWTVDDRLEVERVTDCGVDAIITNDPRLLLPAA